MDFENLESLLDLLPCGDDKAARGGLLGDRYRMPEHFDEFNNTNEVFSLADKSYFDMFLSDFNSTASLFNGSTGNKTLPFLSDYPLEQGIESLCNLTALMNNNLMGNDIFKIVMEKLNVYFTPIIILIGTTGNLLSFLVFTATHVKRQSSSVYLASLALVDILFLMCLLIVWLSWIRVPLLHRNGWCQMTVYFQYVTTFMSVYIVTAFTVERYIIVNHPFKKDKLCTTSKAVKVVIILGIVGCVLYSFSIFTNGIVYVRTLDKTHQFCTPLYSHYNFLTIYTALDSVLTLIIPSLAIVSLNITIARKIIKLSHERKGIEAVQVLNSSLKKKLMRETVSDLGLAESHNNNNSSNLLNSSHHAGIPMYGNNSMRRCQSDVNRFKCSTQPLQTTTLNGRNIKCSMRIAQSRIKAQYKTVRMLLIVSSVFVLLNLPSHAFRIHAFFQSSVHDRYATEIIALRWHELFQLLYHLNFSINFFLYSLYGRNFRKGLQILWYRITHGSLKCCRNIQFLDERLRLNNIRRKDSGKDIYLVKSNLNNGPGNHW